MKGQVSAPVNTTALSATLHSRHRYIIYTPLTYRWIALVRQSNMAGHFLLQICDTSCHCHSYKQKILPRRLYMCYVEM